MDTHSDRIGRFILHPPLKSFPKSHQLPLYNVLQSKLGNPLEQGVEVQRLRAVMKGEALIIEEHDTNETEPGYKSSIQIERKESPLPCVLMRTDESDLVRDMPNALPVLYVENVAETKPTDNLDGYPLSKLSRSFNLIDDGYHIMNKPAEEQDDEVRVFVVERLIQLPDGSWRKRLDTQSRNCHNVSASTCMKRKKLLEGSFYYEHALEEAR